MSKGKHTTILNYEIDEDKTCSNVKHFFKVDYPAIKRMCNRDPTGLSSPAMTGMPSGSPAGNPTENRVINWIDARQAKDGTKQAIDCCSRWSREILRIWGLEGNVDDDRYVISQLPYESSWYYDHKRIAMIEFAEAYPHQRLLAYLDK